MDENIIIDLQNVTVRFNKSNMKVDNLKEYFVRLISRQLNFQEFIALEDVNMKIKKGESWGIVGTNGAGKSTLLKVISKILKPYKGSVRVEGTIASLIELGAGIDANLTARENIYLNGTLLGHTKEFMDNKFDEIVEFSELQDFLDSPVKNFSSGMKARLGFSIATAIEPDVLIVDEILSVGDMLFRKKCSEKMNAMLKNGVTLLYVSHNVNSVKSLCKNAVWLNKGKVIMSGSSKEICAQYVAKAEERKKQEAEDKLKKLDDIKSKTKKIK